MFLELLAYPLGIPSWCYPTFDPRACSPKKNDRSCCSWCAGLRLPRWLRDDPRFLSSLIWMTRWPSASMRISDEVEPRQKAEFFGAKITQEFFKKWTLFYRNIWSCLGMHQNCTKFGQEHGGKHRPWDMDMPQGSSLLFKSVQMLMFDIFLINRPINLHHCGDRTRAIAYLQCYCLSTLDVRFLRTDVWRCSNKTYSGFSCGRFQSYHMKWQTSLELKP